MVILTLDDFDEEIAEEHATLLPILFSLITEGDESIYSEALSSLDVMIESLGDDVLPYIDPLMTRLINLWTMGSRKVQITATNCIGSVAYSSSNVCSIC